MSVQSALKFIQSIRSDPGLKDRLAVLAPVAGLESLVQLARDAGFSFTEADLRQAFQHDWAMRRLRRARPGPPAA
ncbi:MAG: Nif11-like leader peptide family natural product precursor [Anaerolineales bacterium]